MFFKRKPFSVFGIDRPELRSLQIPAFFSLPVPTEQMILAQVPAFYFFNPDPNWAGQTLLTPAPVRHDFSSGRSIVVLDCIQLCIWD